MSVYLRYLADFCIEESELVVKLDEFEVGDTIGKGGFGEVKRAIQKKTGVQCAIKQIFNERLEGNRFRRYVGEIETLAQCDNMFLVPFIGFTADPPYAIVTEFMPNGSLDRYIRIKSDECTLTGTQLTAIAMGIAFGMLHLHINGIIHRDLKSANILLDSRLFPRICDFGIARFEESGTVGMTAKIGTPNYMAPELISSTEYDRKVDVYAYAMILYEMCEHVRPFKGMKIGEIFKAVIENNERPKLTSSTPIPLQRLISRCWDRDPQQRPSFEEIFEEFSLGRVAFPNTKRFEIENFLKTIEQDEERRDELAQKKTEATQTKNDKNDDSYSYYESVSITEDKEEKIPFVQPIEVKINQNMESEDSSHEQQDPEVVLGDYSSKNFDQYIQYYADALELNQFEAFYRPLSHHIITNAPRNVISRIIQAFNKLMKRNSEFINLFGLSSYYQILPKDPSSVDYAIESFSYLFIKYPKLLGQNLVPHLLFFYEIRPEKMLVLMSYYVQNIMSISNPWPILDSLVSAQNHVILLPCALHYLSLFYYLITNYEVYSKERSIHIRSVFIKCIDSPYFNVVEMAYNGLSCLYTDFSGIDFTKVSHHLLDDRIWKSALALLIRIKVIIPSQNLVDALVFRSNFCSKAWIPVLNIASTKKGSSFLIQNPIWMKEYKNHPTEVYRVILTLFKSPDNRKPLSSSECFTLTLKEVLVINPKQHHSSITSVIRRSSLEKEFVTQLSHSGFLRTYISETSKSSQPKLLSNLLALFDFISRIAYTSEYIDVIPICTSLLESNNHKNAALTVIIALSFYPQCMKVFLEKGLLSYFQNLLQDQKYSEYANTFILNSHI